MAGSMVVVGGHGVEVVESLHLSHKQEAEKGGEREKVMAESGACF